MSNNSSDDDYSGGIINRGGTITLNNSTITGNSANYRGQGGGLKNIAGTVHISNTIIARNSATTSPDCSGQISSLGNNLISNGTGCNISQEDTSKSDLVGAQNNLVYPLLGPLQDNGGPTLTQALLPGSPAIDAGNNASCSATDQRGVARPQGNNCDIGAFEVSPPKYIVFLGGINSHSPTQTGDSPPVKESFKDIRRELEQSAVVSHFVYFSYGAANDDQLSIFYCNGWGADACTGGKDFSDIGDLKDLERTPVYTK